MIHPRPALVPPLVLVVLLALGAGCGSGGMQGDPITSPSGGFLPTEALPTTEPAVFLIRRGDMPFAAGGVTVHFDARSGTPFLDGTASTVMIRATFEVPGQLRGALPALQIPHTLPGEVLADVRVQFDDGSLLGGAPMTARFLPRPPPPPATIIACEPGLLLSGASACFQIAGTRFGALDDAVTIDFVAITGTPFQGGTSTTLTVPAVVTGPGTLRGVLPPDAVTGDVLARVTAHLATGESPTSPGALVTLAPERKLVASDGLPYDYFGTDVAIDGDTAVIGARLADDPAGSAGAAYVFVRQGTAWVQQQRLTAPDAGGSDQFGTAVAIAGDRVAIGAPFEDAAAANGGSVYVFIRSNGVWTLEQKLTASDAAPGDHLGESVAIAGDVIAAGAPDENNARGTDAGAVYLFRRSNAAWVQEQKVVSAAVAAGHHFGQAVGVTSGTLVVGAPGGDQAFAYAYDGSGWSDEQALVAPGIGAGDDFGRAVDVDGDRCLVGAPGGDGAGAGTGTAHVFVRALGTWGHEQALTGTGGGTGDAFGGSVALDGDRALVGALESDLAGSNAGAVWPFARTGAGPWVGEPVLTASDAASSDRFGQAVDLSGCVVLVGAHLDNHAAGTDAGSAYLK